MSEIQERERENSLYKRIPNNENSHFYVLCSQIIYLY